jgi:hypothetical protein
MRDTERRSFLRNSGLAITAAALGEPLAAASAGAQTSEAAHAKEAAPVPPDATHRLAQFILATRYDDLPEAVRHEAKRTLLNWVGCAIGGSRDATVTNAIAALAPFIGAPQASVLGRGERADALNAALLNGISSHVLDFDDTHAENAIHPAAPVAPAILALAEYRPVSGRDLLGALLVGVETECRIGNAVSPAHYDVGWHITGTAGVFGAAAAAGKLLGLNEQQMTWALGLAAVQPVGLQEMFGSMTKLPPGTGGAERAHGRVPRRQGIHLLRARPRGSQRLDERSQHRAQLCGARQPAMGNFAQHL